FVEPGPRTNPYREVGRALAARPDCPRSLVALEPQICWFSGARRVRPLPADPADVPAYLASTGADGIVLGPEELGSQPLYPPPAAPCSAGRRRRRSRPPRRGSRSRRRTRGRGRSPC